MPKIIRIRNVPARLRRRLKSRAAIEGLSMSDYILREVGKALDCPTRQEVIDRLRARPRRRLKPSAADGSEPSAGGNFSSLASACSIDGSVFSRIVVLEMFSSAEGPES
jgi:plasmid stability protein